MAEHQHGHAHQHGHQHGGGLAEVLDLDAEVLHEFHAEVLAAVTAAVGVPLTIVDLGAGTGTGTLRLARHFPAAEVVAVDVSDEMLNHLRHRAAGLGERVRTVTADLDAGWPAGVGPADLAWASGSLHHLADPERVLADVFAALRPGGVFAVVELASFPWFLPAAAGGGVVGRVYEMADRARAHDLPTMGSDWGTRLAAAGFAVETARTFDIALTRPLPPAAGRFAEATFRRLHDGLGDRLGDTDRSALAALADEIAGRDDLTVRTSRSLWLARRPA